jgi:hypothetical protein
MSDVASSDKNLDTTSVENARTAAQTEIEAAVFRRLLEHLDANRDVQNIDLMTVAGFCRNCLAKWYVAAADEQGEAINYDQAREHVYRMPYGEWKDRYQSDVSPEKLAAFQAQQQQ